MITPLAKPLVPVNELGDPTVPVNELGDPYPVAQNPQTPTNGKLAHVLTTADGLGGVVAPPPQGQVEGNLAKKLNTDYQKDADPYGSPDNHPGFFGKLAHALSHATGGDTRRQWEEQGLTKQLNDVTAQESQNQSRDASTANIQSETDERPGNDLSRRNMEHAQADNLESEVSARQEPNLANAYSHAVNQAIKEGRDPATDPIVAHLSDAIVALQPGQNKVSEAPKTTDIVGPDSKVHTMGFDAKTGKYDTDEGLSGFKPNVTHINMGADRAAKNDIIKAYQPTLDSAERLNVMTESYEKAVKDHDQQAMLNLLANHLGMTMGLQKGARLTKDIINEAKQSQPWLAGLQSKFDKDGYLSGVTLSPNQMRQMVALGQERYTEDVKKSRATSQYMGATDDGPQRIPGPATVRFYTGKANGDPARAKALAVADGWSVQ